MSQPEKERLQRQKQEDDRRRAEEYVDQEKDRISGVFEEAFVRSTSEGYQDESMWMESRWTKFKNAYEPGMPTGCDEKTLKEVGIATTVMPEGFTLHKSLERIMKVRRKTVRGAGWAGIG